MCARCLERVRTRRLECVRARRLERGDGGRLERRRIDHVVGRLGGRGLEALVVVDVKTVVRETDRLCQRLAGMQVGEELVEDGLPRLMPRVVGRREHRQRR